MLADNAKRESSAAKRRGVAHAGGADGVLLEQIRSRVAAQQQQRTYIFN